jgi:hypothetical protein
MTKSKPTYCAWDGVSEPGRVHSKLIDTDWQDRQRRRVAFLRGGMEDEAAIAKEMAARIRYWRGSGRSRGGQSSEVSSDPVSIIFRVVLGVVLISLVGRVFFHGFSFLIANPHWLFGGLGVFLLIGIPIDLKGRRRRRVFASLVDDTCPTCGYDLSNLASVPIGDENVRLGPPACPECGAPWPLVPPPAPWMPDDSHDS